MPITMSKSALAQLANSAINGLIDKTECDVDDALSTLLACLMHYADSLDIDFDEAMEWARIYYNSDSEEV